MLPGARIVMWCPVCSALHVDAGEWEFRLHHKHLCLDCGHVWQPSPFHSYGRPPETPWEHARAYAMVAKRLLKRALLAALDR